jgi:PAP2 superfamily
MAEPGKQERGRASVSTGLTRRQFLKRSGAVAAGAISASTFGLPTWAWAASSPFPLASSFDAEVATTWLDLSLELVRGTAGFTPPVASRAFAFVGVTLYEALLPGMPGNRSLSGLVNELPRLSGAGHNSEYHWPAVANSALAAIHTSLFPTAPGSGQAAMDGLEARFAEEFRGSLPRGVFNRSVDRGREVADAVFDWSKRDGGHEGYLMNFPTEYAPPVGPGLWTPTPPGFLRALQPFWGSNRPCVLASGAVPSPGDHTPYSEARPSAFFAEAMEVYETVNDLTPEQRTIALYWSDDPGATATPPGHSISMTTQVLRDRGVGLDVAAEAYARVGLAVGDAFVSCWNAKYRYNLLRPITYIRNLVDATWNTLLITPPFPEYTSGHSVQSGAWAQVMTDLFGAVSFTDHTHDSRGLTPRSFGSFFEAAQEAAISRLYGGIHFRPAIERGVEQGVGVGRAVSALPLRG